MSDVSHLSESRIATQNGSTEPGEFLAMLMLWAGPLMVFATALFMAR